LSRGGRFARGSLTEYDAEVISQELLEILACPKCHTKLELKEPDHLRCPHCKVLYPIVDGIPVLLIEEGKPEVESSPA
jgi:uncharacterized protein YbaR (Trm112 family)